jgi:protein-histidine pros-kinase
LGLTIAQDIVRRHGGQLRLSNAPEGGLLAEVLLPRSPSVALGG